MGKRSGGLPPAAQGPGGEDPEPVANRSHQSTAEEFESPDLRRERLVPPGQQVVIRVGPQRAGSYGFIGEFNPATAHGQIVAK